MYLKKGEVRKVGIEVISQLNQNFVIDAADFSIMKASGEVVEIGIPTIDNYKIATLFSANEVGKFYCEFTYRIGPEILKAKIFVEVM